MKIINHLLYHDDDTPITFRRSPNVDGEMQPHYLVVHYTAGANVSGAVGCLTNPANSVSAHLVIGRDGSFTQLVPFNIIAWHAGISSWEGRESMNQYSIGIELDNAGRMSRKKGEWVSSFNTTYSDSDVLKARHKHSEALYGWHRYTQKQLDALMEVSETLFRIYSLIDVVGHDDIAPRRKVDPGPAFPMEEFRQQLRSRVGFPQPIFEATENLPIHISPDGNSTLLPNSPLLPGQHIERVNIEGSWWFITALDEMNAPTDIQGWVYDRSLRRVFPPRAEETNL